MIKKLLLLIALALVLAAGVFVLSQMNQRAVAPVVTEALPAPSEETPTIEESLDTSDWKTYRNEEYGFEVKYPKEYQVFDDYLEKKTIFVSSVENGSHRVPGIFIRMADQAVSSQALLEQIQASSQQMKQNMLQSNTSIHFGLNNMISAQKIIYSAEIGYDVTNYLFSINNVPFQIEVKMPIPLSPEIINSFRFLK